VSALANHGLEVSDQTVGNILCLNGIGPARIRLSRKTWKDFIRSHMAALVGTDFFSLEVVTLRGLVTSRPFFIHLETRQVEIERMTTHPNEVWMKQIVRNVTMDEWRFLENIVIRFMIGIQNIVNRLVR
jgi:hypothetical protein